MNHIYVMSDSRVGIILAGHSMDNLVCKAFQRLAILSFPAMSYVHGNDMSVIKYTIDGETVNEITIEKVKMVGEQPTFFIKQC